MMTFSPIQLDSGWQTGPADDQLWEDLTSLAALPSDRFSPDGSVRLRCVFDLEPMGEVCRRYWLYLASVPADVAVSVNGYPVTLLFHEGGQVCSADITDHISLEDNELMLTLNGTGNLSSVIIQPVPCPTNPG